MNDRMDDLDRRARAAAKRMGRAVESEVDVEGDLEWVRRRSSEYRTPDTAIGVAPRRVLLVAACASLVIAGAVAIVALGGGDRGQMSETTVAELPSVSPTTPSTVAQPTIVTPTSPVTTAVAISTTAPPADSGVDCAGVVLPPISLADGSTPGEPTLNADGVYGMTASWGSQPLTAVLQPIDLPPSDLDFDPDQSHFGLRTEGDFEASMDLVDDARAGRYEIHLRGPADFCPRTYFVNLNWVDANALFDRWLGSLAAGTPIPGGDHPEFPVPVEYRGMSYDDRTGEPTYHRFSTVGINVGVADPIDVGALTAGVRLDDGRVVRYAPGSQWDGTPCANRDIELVDDDEAAPLHADIPAVRSAAVTTSGVLFATRGVCEKGASVPGAGTYVELLRLDLRDSPVVPRVLLVEDFEQEGGHPYANALVSNVSNDARYLGMLDPYNTEQARFHVIDTTGRPDEPMVLPSGCAAPGDIIGRPAFVEGGVVVARWCPDATGSTGRVVVDHIALPDRTLQWSGVTLGHGLYPSYGNTVGFSVFLDPADRSPWAIVNGSDIEQPTTSILLHGDDVVDITHLGMSALAFRLEDLIEPLS